MMDCCKAGGSEYKVIVMIYISSAQLHHAAKQTLFVHFAFDVKGCWGNNLSIMTVHSIT